MLFVLKLTLAVLSFSIAVEAADFVSAVVTIVLVLSPLWLLARLIRLATRHGSALKTEESFRRGPSFGLNDSGKSCSCPLFLSCILNNDKLHGLD